MEALKAAETSGNQEEKGAGSFDIVDSTANLYTLIQNDFYKDLMLVPDTVPELKKFCLYQTVKEYFKERLKHGGLDLDYLNSISRYDRQAHQYILVLYGPSSIVCH